jgi:hypothetical protein
VAEAQTKQSLIDRHKPNSPLIDLHLPCVKKAETNHPLIFFFGNSELYISLNRIIITQQSVSKKAWVIINPQASSPINTSLPST